MKSRATLCLTLFISLAVANVAYTAGTTKHSLKMQDLRTSNKLNYYDTLAIYTIETELTEHSNKEEFWLDSLIIPQPIYKALCKIEGLDEFRISFSVGGISENIAVQIREKLHSFGSLLQATIPDQHRVAQLAGILSGWLGLNADALIQGKENFRYPNNEGKSTLIYARAQEQFGVHHLKKLQEMIPYRDNSIMNALFREDVLESNYASMDYRFKFTDSKKKSFKASLQLATQINSNIMRKRLDHPYYCSDFEDLKFSYTSFLGTIPAPSMSISNDKTLPNTPLITQKAAFKDYPRLTSRIVSPSPSPILHYQFNITLPEGLTKPSFLYIFLPYFIHASLDQLSTSNGEVTLNSLSSFRISGQKRESFVLKLAVTGKEVSIVLPLTFGILGHDEQDHEQQRGVYMPPSVLQPSGHYEEVVTHSSLIFLKHLDETLVFSSMTSSTIFLCLFFTAISYWMIKGHIWTN